MVVDGFARDRNGASGVSDARRQQVRDAAGKLGYRRNSQAAELRSSRSTSIGFVVPDLTNSFFIELTGALENYALASGYRLIMAHAQEDAERGNVSGHDGDDRQPRRFL